MTQSASRNPHPIKSKTEHIISATSLSVTSKKSKQSLIIHDQDP